MVGTMQFEAKITDVEPVNPLFSRCKIYVMYTGANRNGSYISKETVEKALPTIYNIPIIGEFSEAIDDFKGHGGKIEISDDGVKFIKTTKPYGVVPESAVASWETVDGQEYLVLEGCYLWTGRYEEANKVIEEGKGQSMEIEIVDGAFNKATNVYEIKEMIFSALCILGDDVEPCFEGASIVAYSLDKESFMAQFKEMLAELKQFTLSQEEGGSNLKVKTMPENFALSQEQLEGELRRMISEAATYQDDWWFEDLPKYGLVDYYVETGVAVAIDFENNYLVGFSFAVDGDQVSIDFDSAKRYKVEYVPMEVEGEDGDENVTNGADADDFALAYKAHIEYAMKLKNESNLIPQETEPVSGEFEVEEPVGEGEEPTGEGEKPETPETTETPEPPAEPPVNHSVSDVDVVEMARTVAALQAELDAIRPQFEALKEFKAQKDAEEAARLAAERAEAENALFAKFADKLTEEEISAIREKASEFSLEELENQLLLAFAKKAVAQFSLNSNKPTGLAKIPVGEEPKKRTNVRGWEAIAEKYGFQPKTK